jgi:DNA-binding transcriptional MerR regulator
MVKKSREQTESAIAFLKNGIAGIADCLPATPLTILQAAQHIGISVPLLRRWEQYGLITVSRHPRNHYRLFNAVELGWLYVIRMLRQAGHTITACLQMLPKRDQLPRDNQHVSLLSAAKHWLSLLAAHETHGTTILHQIETMFQEPTTAAK